MIPAIIKDQGEHRIGQLCWGLIPSWAQDEKIGYKMINTRAKQYRKNLLFGISLQESAVSFRLMASMNGNS